MITDMEKDKSYEHYWYHTGTPVPTTERAVTFKLMLDEFKSTFFNFEASLPRYSN
jgi:hypothetical protein